MTSAMTKPPLNIPSCETRNPLGLDGPRVVETIYPQVESKHTLTFYLIFNLSITYTVCIIIILLAVMKCPSVRKTVKLKGPESLLLGDRFNERKRKRVMEG